MTLSLIPDPSRNEDLLRRVYDPAYVRRVGLVRSQAPVRVCLDSRMLDVRGTGVATYAAVLARCLPRAGATPMLLRQALPNDSGPRPRARRWLAAWNGSTPRAAHLRDCTPDEQGAHELVCADVFREAQVFFNLHRRLMPVSCPEPPPVMHWTYPVPLFFEGSLNVYTVHDVIPITHPSLTPISRRRHGELLARIAERAHRIVTVSEAAGREIAAHLAVGPDRIVSLSQAADIAIQRDPPLPEGIKAGAYFLFCGLIEPRKNLVALARAHARSGSSLPLVIAGPEGWRAAEIRRALAKYPLVRILPWQERDRLIALIRRARGLVLASLAEGFGLPIIEAMTLGTPVIASSLPATAEVAGGAALLVDPCSIDEMADAFARLAADDRLVVELRRLGFARANHFTLDRYAVRLRDFYAALVDKAGTREAGQQAAGAWA